MTDYISREDLLKEVEELNAVSFYELNDHSNEAYQEIKNLIEHISAADVVERKTGKWIRPTRVPDSMLNECSLCGFDTGAFSFNFCPNCGARMSE